MSESAISEVAEFLSQSSLKGFTGGKWVNASDSATLTTRDPGTGEPLADVADLSSPGIFRFC